MTPDRCPWYVAGPLFGLLIVGLRAVANKPFGALGGYVDLASNALSPRRLGFRAYLLLGLVLGGLLYALTVGALAPSLGYGTVEGPISGTVPRQLALLLAAGAIMGFGARTAGGCTSGHGMCGMSLGSAASAVSSMTFFVTAVTLAHALLWFGGARYFVGLVFGFGFGFVLAWSRLTDPSVIRKMLLLHEPDVFLLMGLTVVTAAIGVRLLRTRGARAIVGGELVAWTVEKPEARHVLGSLFFGAGWSLAGTCPGPVAAMIGEGRLGGVAVAIGLLGGVMAQGALARSRVAAKRPITTEVPGAAGL